MLLVAVGLLLLVLLMVIVLIVEVQLGIVQLVVVLLFEAILITMQQDRMDQIVIQRPVGKQVKDLMHQITIL